MSYFKNIQVVSVNVRDWEGAKAFYSRVLEWPVAFGADEYGWVEYGFENETHLAISRWESTDPIPTSGTTPVFTVEDTVAVTQALRAKGVRCDDPVTIPGMVTYGTFYDPEGNRIQFASSGS